MTGSRVRYCLLGAVVIIWAIQTVHAWANPRGDFLLHHEFGRRLREGEFLYQNGMHVPYPPAWAVPHAPLSLLAPGPAKALVHLVGAASLVLLFWILHDLSKSALPLPRGRLFWVVAATLVAAFHIVMRDFDDGGQNVILLALAWVAVWLTVNGRPVLGGVPLGLSIALKCTSGVFVLYFLLKREWRAAFSALAFSGLYLLSPLLWQSTTEFTRDMNCWKNTLVGGLTQPDPSVGVLGPEKLQNRSLRNSLARYLMHLPSGHPGRAYIDELPDGDPTRVANPASVDFLDFSPATAGLVIKVVMGFGLLAAGWLLCGRQAGADRLRFLWEVSIVGVLGLLYSPITWGQHCVAVLPALYLMARTVAARKSTVPWMKQFLIGFALLFLLTDRMFLGKPLSVLVESYHVPTWGLVALVVALFAARPGQNAAACLPLVVEPRSRAAA